jgi:amidohydrolase
VVVLCGSAYRNRGIEPLLEAVVAYLPSPLDVPAVRGTADGSVQERVADPAAPFAALVFKVNSTATGRLTYLRLYSGTIGRGEAVLDVEARRTERIGRILRVQADRHAEVERAVAGDIVAVVGVKSARTGATLCTPAAPLILEPPKVADPVVSVAVEARRSIDTDRLASALARLVEEDPSLSVRTDRETGQTVLSGMGELQIAAGGAAAAIAAVRTLPDHSGTIAVIGTPGEEMGGAGKIRLSDAGVFECVDAAVMFHPGDRSLTTQHTLAAAHLRVRFTGVSTHAAKSPWEGRSALAAAQLFLGALDTMRQFMPPTARVHGIVSDGGQAPNVVPARAAVDLYVRDRTAASAEALVERVRKAAMGAALATETEAEVCETGPLYAERRNNTVLAARFGATVRALGLHIAPGDPDSPAGSSDIGNLSQLLPVIHPCVQIAGLGTPSHSDAMRETAATSFAHDRTQIAATGLVRVVCDLVTDPEFLAAARAEFAAGSRTECTAGSRTECTAG